MTRIPSVKGQAIPAYDPHGVTYATTPMGADHTAGYAVTANILKVGGFVDPNVKDGQVDVLSLGQNILKVELEFNKRAGFTKADDRLPEFFSTEVLEPHKTTFDITGEELDQVHKY